ncbi:MAG: hypothetical protein WC683_13620 [bacterium]
MRMSVELQGLERLERKLQPELVAGPVRQFFKESTDLLLGRVLKNAPNDLGTLKSRISSSIDSRQVPLWGKVVSRAPHSHLLEYGVAAHMAPRQPFIAWGERKGVSGVGAWLKMITKGIKGRFFVWRALKDSDGDIERNERKAERAIEQEFERR